MNMSKLALALGSATLLAGCGGGGGGPGATVTDPITSNPSFDGISGTVSSLQSTVESVMDSASIAALFNPTEQDQQDASRVVAAIEQLVTDWEDYKTQLALENPVLLRTKLNDPLWMEAEAAVKLLVEDIKPIAQKVSTGQGVDNTDLEKFADDSAVDTIIEQRKKEIFEQEAPTIVTSKIASVNESATLAETNEQLTNTEVVVSAENTSQNGLDRVKTWKEQTVETYQKTRTIKYISKQIKVVVYSDGTVEKSVLSEKSYTNDIVVTSTKEGSIIDKAQNIAVVDTVTKANVTTTEKLDPVVETTTEDVVETINNEDGSTTKRTKRITTKNTTNRTKTVVTNPNTTVYTYADGYVHTVDGDDEVDESIEETIETNVTQEVVAEEVIHNVVSEKTTYEEATETTEGEPTFVTSYEDTTEVTETETERTTTVTRNFTTVGTIVVTTTVTRTPVVAKTYSDGRVVEERGEPEVSTSTENKTVTDTWSTVISVDVEEIEATEDSRQTIEQVEENTVRGETVTTSTYVDEERTTEREDGSKLVEVVRTTTYTDTTPVQVIRSVTPITYIYWSDDTVTEERGETVDTVISETEEVVTRTEETVVSSEVVNPTVTVVDTSTTSEMVSREITDTVYGDWNQTVNEVKQENMGDFTVEYTKYRNQRSVTNIITTTYLDTTVTTYSNNTTETTTAERVVEQEMLDSPEVVYTDWTETDRWSNIVEEEEPTNPVTDNNLEVTYDSVDYTDANLGTPTAGVLSATEYRSTANYDCHDKSGCNEYWSTISVADDQMATIKAEAAWSRGWTGKGSKIVIADSGAKVDHTDLDNNIVATKNFLDNSTDVTDNVGHGTHVAGSAAAEWNGTGMVGVAPDAKLMIAKVTDSTGYSFFYARKAMEWGVANNATVINMSASSRYDNAFKSSLTKHSTGLFSSNHWYYGVNGYNGYLDESNNWKISSGGKDGNIVMVVAAGNDGLDYAAYPGTMATATDENGNLVLGGRMIVAGSWDIANEQISGFSNKAGHVCINWNEAEQQCNDSYRVRDFYLMAPGQSVYSTINTGGYNHMSGTSMAAPQISGAIAVIHQMWPHMTGGNLVKLLLETANKNLPKYNMNIHGQGLLDMDTATQPVGATGIPKTGRTSGGVSSLSGGIAGSVDLGDTASATMVLDSYERDFYVDLSSSTARIDTRKTSFAENAHNGWETNSFASIAGAVRRAFDTVLATDEDSQFAVGQRFGNWELGAVQEKDTMLGNQFSGVFGIGEYSHTVYGAYNASKTAYGLNFIGRAEVGYTLNNADANDSMVTAVNDVTSVALHSGVFKEVGNYTFGATASIPTRIVAGELELDVPVARTLDGRVITEQQSASLSTGRTEVDFGLSFNYNTESHNLGAYVEERINYAGTNNNTTEYGVKYEFKF